MQESFEYRTIGSWWKSKGSQNEVDIVAVTLDNKKSNRHRSEATKKEF